MRTIYKFCYWLRDIFWRSRNNIPKIPKESLRSLILEGVIEITGQQVGDNRFRLNIKSPVPLRRRINNDGYLELAYWDGSSNTVINSDILGEDFGVNCN